MTAEEQRKAFEEAAKPLMKYLRENHNPHSVAVICCHGGDLLHGVLAFDSQILDEGAEKDTP